MQVGACLTAPGSRNSQGVYGVGRFHRLATVQCLPQVLRPSATVSWHSWPRGRSSGRLNCAASRAMHIDGDRTARSKNSFRHREESADRNTNDRGRLQESLRCKCELRHAPRPCASLRPREHMPMPPPPMPRRAWRTGKISRFFELRPCTHRQSRLPSCVSRGREFRKRLRQAGRRYALGLMDIELVGSLSDPRLREDR